MTQLGVRILPGTLAEAKFPDESFDVVTMWDVLEHVPDPLTEVREVFRILRPGGLLVVNYPDIGTWIARLAGRQWWFLLSVHLTYFTQNTLKAMLSRVGFTALSFRPHYQVLNLGHLIKMGGLYVPVVSKVFGRTIGALRLDSIPIPYYASQTNAMARKPSIGSEPQPR